MTFEKFVAQLAKELSGKLPGNRAQLRMAPEGRLTPVEMRDQTEAAVLILLFKKRDIPFIILTRRTEYDGAHSGQISLPGGKRDADDKDLMETALRETAEEIGIPPEEVHLLGKLTDLFIPVSNFIVTPFVGYINGIPKFKIDPEEVKYTIELPLRSLVDPGSIKRKRVQISGKELSVPYFYILNEEIWGATAMILSEFIDMCKSVLPENLS